MTKVVAELEEVTKINQKKYLYYCYYLSREEMDELKKKVGHFCVVLFFRPQI